MVNFEDPEDSEDFKDSKDLKDSKDSKDSKELVPAAKSRESRFPILAQNENDLKSMIENFGTGTEWAPPMVEFPGVGGYSFITHGKAGDEDRRYLDVIMLGAVNIRSYFPHTIDESGQNSAPDCVSYGALVGRGTPGGDCRVCPLARFGSAPNGVAPACRLRRKLLFNREGKRLPETMILPPTSVQSCTDYFTRLYNDGLSPDGVVTRIALRKVKNSRTNSFYPVAEFACVEELTAQERENMREKARVFLGRLRRSNEDNQ